MPGFSWEAAFQHGAAFRAFPGCSGTGVSPQLHTGWSRVRAAARTAGSQTVALFNTELRFTHHFNSLLPDSSKEELG